MANIKWFEWLEVVSLVLLAIGGLFLGLVGLFGFDLVATYVGGMSLYSRIAYVLIGLAAVYQVASTFYHVRTKRPKFA